MAKFLGKATTAPAALILSGSCTWHRRMTRAGTFISQHTSEPQGQASDLTGIIDSEKWPTVHPSHLLHLFLREHLVPRWLLGTLAHVVRIKGSAAVLGLGQARGWLWLLFPAQAPLPKSVADPQSRGMNVYLLSWVLFPCAVLRWSRLLLDRQLFPFFLPTSCSPRTQTLHAVLRDKAERCPMWAPPHDHVPGWIRPSSQELLPTHSFTTKYI